MFSVGHDEGHKEKSGLAVIYFAGGCFWGMEKLMASLPGVASVVSGYANGVSNEAPTYSQVCTGKTGYRETVKVEYDPGNISLDALLFAFFSVIEPERKNAQGHDLGSQYQAGIYYTDDSAKLTVERVAAIEKERYQKFAVEIAPLQCFYEAEEYHQHYLDKNPGGYCHIPQEKMEYLSKMAFDPVDYKRPAKEIIRQRLDDRQFGVTQKAYTEPPFHNAFWDKFERGIYVDAVTGEPLFSSDDKYESGCGWPSFSKAIDKSAIVELEDRSHFMTRTEVRSRAGNSHLGHVFSGDAESPNGIRYCINSAALRFIPYDKMDAEGYGHLKRFLL